MSRQSGIIFSNLCGLFRIFELCSILTFTHLRFLKMLIQIKKYGQYLLRNKKATSKIISSHIIVHTWCMYTAQAVLLTRSRACINAHVSSLLGNSTLRVAHFTYQHVHVLLQVAVLLKVRKSQKIFYLSILPNKPTKNFPNFCQPLKSSQIKKNESTLFLY